MPMFFSTPEDKLHDLVQQLNQYVQNAERYKTAEYIERCKHLTRCESFIGTGIENIVMQLQKELESAQPNFYAMHSYIATMKAIKQDEIVYPKYYPGLYTHPFFQSDTEKRMSGPFVYTHYINTLNTNIADDLAIGLIGLMKLPLLPFQFLYNLTQDPKHAPLHLIQDFFTPLYLVITSIIFPLSMLISKYETDSYNILNGKLDRMLGSMQDLSLSLMKERIEEEQEIEAAIRL